MFGNKTRIDKWKEEQLLYLYFLTNDAEVAVLLSPSGAAEGHQISQIHHKIFANIKAIQPKTAKLANTFHNISEMFILSKLFSVHYVRNIARSHHR